MKWLYWLLVDISSALHDSSKRPVWVQGLHWFIFAGVCCQVVVRAAQYSVETRDVPSQSGRTIGGWLLQGEWQSVIRQAGRCGEVGMLIQQVEASCQLEEKQSPTAESALHPGG